MDTGADYPHNQNGSSETGDPGSKKPGSHIAKRFTKVPNALLRDPTLSPTEKTVLCLLLSYSWGKDSCWVSQERLASESGLTLRGLRHILLALRQREIITRKRRGRGKTNVYGVNLAKWAQSIDDRHCSACHKSDDRHRSAYRKRLPPEEEDSFMKHEAVVSAPALPSQETTPRPQDTPKGIALKEYVKAWSARFVNMEATPEEYAEAIGRHIDRHGVDVVYDEITRHLEEGWDYDGHHNGNCHPGTLIRALRTLGRVSA